MARHIVTEEPVPVLPLEYETQAAKPFREVVRVIGLLAALSCAIALLSWLLQLGTFLRNTHRYPAWIMQISILAYVFELVLGIAELVGGILCMHLKSSGRKVLVAWAWGRLALAVFTLCFDGYYDYMTIGVQVSFWQQFSYLVSRVIVGLTIPMVVLLLLNRKEFDGVFQTTARVISPASGGMS